MKFRMEMKLVLIWAVVALVGGVTGVRAVRLVEGGLKLVPVQILCPQAMDLVVSVLFLGPAILKLVAVPLEFAIHLFTMAVLLVRLG